MLLPTSELLRQPIHPPVSSSAAPPPPPLDSSHIPSHRLPSYEDDKHVLSTPRRRATNSDSFVHAAEHGARAQSVLDTANGRVFEAYQLGKTIVASSKLYANQRRSNRLLPGGSDSTTAACYMIGGTSDETLATLLKRISPCDPREERCKAVERVLKDKTRGAICALNGENPREARADNLAAVRICETVADILVAYLSRRLIDSREELLDKLSRHEATIKQLRDELSAERKRREAGERECWCKGSAEKNQPSAAISGMTNANINAPHAMADLHTFERDKLLVGRGYLSSSGFRSHASGGHSLADAVEKVSTNNTLFVLETTDAQKAARGDKVNQ
ncbi:hypothetical protein BWQ96_03999 [Gracilariopsis chorda]|uniref:Uncharacterized protein n=1 Tax=Gracilariopsis chorda TaxID=448386 RepID=A0A2V3IVQ3_9FLOR|nr:hypothetical protein BWQ96_03999 [Gracilariopsis chorda]|eukprot:PXF46214.1 hypothetical protein BWQ96_03999 [Gracilariopsis chorda]